ncbi:MAG TPA: DUF6158 family protein [Micromonospora sp.]|nr:DUF6158 family protein [Micromonospora sp.]
MTEFVRHSGYSPASSGTPFEPVDVSPEQRMGQWRGDQYRSTGVVPPPAAEFAAETELDEMGIDPAELSDDDLMREMQSLHRTRLATLRHAADTALATHLRRTAELETEYLNRYPGREIDPSRLRDGC